MVCAPNTPSGALPIFVVAGILFVLTIIFTVMDFSTTWHGFSMLGNIFMSIIPLLIVMGILKVAIHQLGRVSA